jgi:hypothetical protein
MAHPLNQIRRLGFPDHRDDFLLNFAVFDALPFHKRQCIPSSGTLKHFPKKNSRLANHPGVWGIFDEEPRPVIAATDQ